MARTFFALVSLLVAAAVALVLTGDLLPNPWFVYIFKPLATVLLLWLAFYNWRASKRNYALWISVGLLFSLFGDVALIWPSRYFLPGLLAFLLTHIAYLFAFTREVRFPARPLLWLPYLALAATAYLVLLPHLPHTLRFPVAFYSVFLCSMAAQSMGRFMILKNAAARRAAIGAGFFLLSDLLLSFDRFHTPLILAPVLILIPYYLGQWLIASSTLES